MKLKQAMLISLGLDELRQIASSLNLSPVDRSDKRRLVKALLNAPAVTQGMLLEHLSASDLRQVKALCQVPDDGPKSRQTRTARKNGRPSLAGGPQRRSQVTRQPAGRASSGSEPTGNPQNGNQNMPSTCFVAIDFETADSSRNSACAVALVRVVDDAIVDKTCFLIRPPRRNFVFSYLHGITWADVAHAPTFAELWPQLLGKFDGASFLAAHNAAFDRSVLRACCQAAGLEPPAIPFRCTVQAARKTWKIYPTKLPDVCAFLNLPLQHHDAASDAEACARIMIAARKAGFR